MRILHKHKWKEKKRHNMMSKFINNKTIPGYLLIIEECECGKTRNIHKPLSKSSDAKRGKDA